MYILKILFKRLLRINASCKPKIIYIIYIILISFAAGNFFKEQRYHHAYKIAYIQKNEYLKQEKNIERIKRDAYEAKLKLNAEIIKNQMLNEKINALIKKEITYQKEIDLYRKITNPKRKVDGIKINNFKIFKRNARTAFFSAVLTQVNLKKKKIKGNYSIELVGQSNKEKKIIDISNILLKNNDFKLDFIYFQEIQGVINLPKNFVISKANFKIKTNKQEKIETFLAKEIFQ